MATPRCLFTLFIHVLLGCQHNPLVLLALYHVERLLEVLPAGLDRRRVLLVARQVGVDQLDQAVEVLCCDLSMQSVFGLF